MVFKIDMDRLKEEWRQIKHTLKELFHERMSSNKSDVTSSSKLFFVVSQLEDFVGEV